MPEPLVTCRALSKTYVTPSGGIEALHSVDASFSLGEITAVVGASGSGKSTLLRALAGLDRPTTRRAARRRARPRAAAPPASSATIGGSASPTSARRRPTTSSRISR